MQKTDGELILVEVAYALPERQRIVALSVTAGCTALQAAKESGIAEEFPEIDLDSVKMGIFSRLLDGKVNPKPADYVLQARDRVEIYRPLLLDPKQARLARAARKKQGSKY
ncbi:MAG: RnfH family protein [Pseudomonadales bacterium]|nr:RnfH family protein [Pseudomonadales bacterium]